MTEDHQKRNQAYNALLEQAPELAPCPFCGNGAHYSTSYTTVEMDSPDKILGGVWVSCDHCLAQVGRGSWDSMENDNGEFNDFTQAAKAWNTRPQS